MPARTCWIKSPVALLNIRDRISNVFVVRDLGWPVPISRCDRSRSLGLVVDFQRELCVLLHDEDRDLVFAIDLAQDLEQIPDAKA